MCAILDGYMLYLQEQESYESSIHFFREYIFTIYFFRLNKVFLYIIMSVSYKRHVNTFKND